MRREQHRPDPPIGGLSYRNNEPGVSRCRSEIANLASDTSERRSARVNERTDDAARGRLSRALLALGDHNRQGGSPDAARRPERLELISSRGDRHLKKRRNSSRLPPRSGSGSGCEPRVRRNLAGGRSTTRQRSLSIERTWAGRERQRRSTCWAYAADASRGEESVAQSANR